MTMERMGARAQHGQHTVERMTMSQPAKWSGYQGSEQVGGKTPGMSLPPLSSTDNDDGNVII